MQGHIHKRVRTDRHGKETVRWYVVVDLGFDHEGRRRQKWHGGFRTRREAEAARAKLVTDVNTGSYVVPGRTTLGEWIRDSWLPMTEPRVKPIDVLLLQAEPGDPRPARARQRSCFSS